MYQLKDNDLVGVSFIDSQIYIHQMVSVKNLILIADIHMSVSVLRYQSDYRVLSTVSRDIRHMEVYAVEFLVDNTTLAFLATDRDQNVAVFMYQPDSAQSSGGSVLIKRADVNLGTWSVLLLSISLTPSPHSIPHSLPLYLRLSLYLYLYLYLSLSPLSPPPSLPLPHPLCLTLSPLQFCRLFAVSCIHCDNVDVVLQREQPVPPAL